MGLMLAALLAQACVPCHTEHSEALKTHKHFAKGVGCEVCHGASQQHRNAVGAAAPDRVAAPEEVPALCGGCHLAERQAYESGMHGKLALARGKKRAPHCGTCHGVHGPRTAIAMKRQCDRCHPSLPSACQSKLACAGCHQPHTLARRSAGFRPARPLPHGRSSVSEPRASASGLTQALLTYECTGSK